MLEILNRRGAEYPAEHNVGHLYHAKPDLQAFYRVADPTNSFNPGIGKTSKRKGWAEGPAKTARLARRRTPRGPTLPCLPHRDLSAPLKMHFYCNL